jgi:predicted RNase H-like nuclease (RuvC/YqgF family)
VVAVDERGERSSSSAPRGESTLGDLVEFLIDNPLLHQALQVALGARERASQASASAIRNLNLPTGTDVDRLARRVRALSERLEEVEDALDELTREVSDLRRERADASTQHRASSQG